MILFYMYDFIRIGEEMQGIKIEAMIFEETFLYDDIKHSEVHLFQSYLL